MPPVQIAEPGEVQESGLYFGSRGRPRSDTMADVFSGKKLPQGRLNRMRMGCSTMGAVRKVWFPVCGQRLPFGHATK